MSYQAPALPQNEEERLRELAAVQILDSAPEQEFDELLRLACTLSGTPMGAITLVDRDRQWFKSRIGMDATETSRDVSFCGHAILGDEMFEVEDAAKDKRFASNPLVTDGPHIRFYAGVPLTMPGGTNLGAICVIDDKPRKLTDDQRKVLEILAKQVVRQIQLRKQVDRLEVSLIKTLEHERELRGSRRLFSAFMDSCPLVGLLKDEEGRVVWYNKLCAERFGVNRKEWLGKTDAERWPASRAEEARQRDKTVLDGGRLVETYESDQAQDGSPQYWSTFRFPFRDESGKRYVASLAIDVTRAATAEAKVAHYQRELEIANERLHELATTDALTGVRNRRAFDERLQHEFALAVRHDLSLSLLMLDVDHFKSFNDAFGHTAGDVMLQNIAKMIQTTVRTTDMVARYGGEEFAVILPNTKENEAKQLAERICLAIETMEPGKRKMTVSIGISFKTPELVNRDHFMALADEALYSAKNKGRNRICVAGDRS
jgi:diguanylate cyclase (GGDEF)-like protein/PAS domain S-box-containing protein